MSVEEAEGGREEQAEVVGDADEALARLAQMKHAEEPESDRPTPYWLGAVVLAAIVGFLWVFPKLLDGGAMDEQRLKEALAYCKYRDDQAPCEDRIRERYDVCVERHEKANKPAHVDTYGQCMTQEFPDFYLTAGYNKR